MIYVYGGFLPAERCSAYHIISNDENSSIKLSWVVPILVIPVFRNTVLSVFKASAGRKAD